MMNNLLLRLASFTMQRILIFGVILGAVFYFTMFDDGSAIEAKIQAVQKDIQEQELKSKESDAALKEVERVRAAVGALGDQFKVVSQALPLEVQMSDVIRAVDTVARTSGVSVKSKEPKPVINHDYYEEIPLRLTLEGSYSEITLFLYYLASMERIMKVTSFSIAAPGAQEKSVPGRLFFDGQVVSYRFVQVKTKPEAPKQ